MYSTLTLFVAQLAEKVDNLHAQEASTMETGSSARIKRGWGISARATDTRWIWPPESSCG